MTQKAKLYGFPLILVFYEIIIYLSNDMYLPALPQMMSDLNISTTDAQLTLTSWFMGSAAMPLVMGVIADRYGRRPVLFIGGIIYALASVVLAVTSHLSVFLFARVIEGAMISSMLVPGYACIHELYDQKEAIRMLAMMGSVSVLAPAFGPLLGGIVLSLIHWRGIFWFIVIGTVLCLLALYYCMPETLTVEKRHPIHLRKIFSQYWRILTNPTYILLLSILGLIFGGFIVWITAGPLLVISSFQYSAIAFGIMQAAVFLAYIIGNHWVKYLLEKITVSALIQLALILCVIGGILVFLTAVMFPTTLYPFLAAMMLYSFGSGLCFSPLNRTIIESSQEPMGVRVAFFSVFLTSFAVLGSGMASLFFNGTIKSLSLLVTAAIVLAGLLKLIFIGKNCGKNKGNSHGRASPHSTE